MFTAADWQTHLGVTVEKEYPVPWGSDVLEGPCPFWPGRRVRETHHLFYCPGIVNAEKRISIRYWHERFKPAKVTRPPWYMTGEKLVDAWLGTGWHLHLTSMPTDKQGLAFSSYPGMFGPQGYGVSSTVSHVTGQILMFLKYKSFPQPAGHEVWCWETTKRYRDHIRFVVANRTSGDLYGGSGDGPSRLTYAAATRKAPKRPAGVMKNGNPAVSD